MTNLNNLHQNKVIVLVSSIIGAICITTAFYLSHVIHAHLLLAASLRFVFFALLTITYYYFPTERLMSRISPKAIKIISGVFAFTAGLELFKVLTMLFFA